VMRPIAAIIVGLDRRRDRIGTCASNPDQIRPIRDRRKPTCRAGLALEHGVRLNGSVISTTCRASKDACIARGGDKARWREELQGWTKSASTCGRRTSRIF
jgi:hypothetical protein